MDADRFDTLAKRLIAPTTRRSALGATVAGGLLSALGFAKAVPETRAAQGGTCVVAFAAQVLQGPSAAQPLTAGGGRGGELRGELSFALFPSGSLDNATLTLADGTSLPVVGQAIGHSLQVRIGLAPRAALVAVGVGERPIAECLGAIDGVATGPQAGDLGDWHAAVAQQARAGGGGQGGSASQGGGNRAAQGGGGSSGNRTNRGGSSGGGSAPSGASGGGASGRGSSGGSSGGQNTGGSSAGAGSSANAPACPPGETLCDNGEGDVECYDLDNSAANCGTCGTRCQSLVCENGRCLSEEEADSRGSSGFECDPDETICDGLCAHLPTDPRHCGACGNACNFDIESCQNGVCVVTPDEADEVCPQGMQRCNGVCVDLQTDPLNCGQCGLPCASELGAGTCIDGDCACSPGTTRCDDVCVNTERDPLNCGGCGNACTDGGECFGGACAPGETSCPQGQTDCGGVCVDLETDPDNCGECGTICPVSPEIFNCEGGVCVPPSCDPLVNCGGLCVDVLTDPLHCGGCGIACPAGEECRGSLCVPVGGGGGCKTGLTPCGTSCANLQTDANNCGACGAACPAGEACVGGECAPGATAGCPEGQLLCGDACRNAIPVFGTNGLVCAGGGAPPTACPAGQVLCNGACYPEGACQPAADCPAGQGLCYGLCRDFLNDPGYCGGCSTGCTGGAYCAAGTCVYCAAGLTPCGAACVDTKTDLANCGGCGNACGTQCLNGQCTGVGPAPLDVTPACALVGESCAFGSDCCSGERCIYDKCYLAAEVCAYGLAKCHSTAGGFFCADTENDPNFCGGCTTRCPAGSECRNGNCIIPSSAASAVQALAPTDVEPQPEPEPVDIEPEPTDIEPEPPAFSCPEGQVDCGGVCTDLSFDPLNCGGCGFVCGSGSACDFGVCGEEPVVAVEEPIVAPEEPVAAPEEPAECLAAGGACDPASPGACCSGVCNGDGACA